MIPGISSNSHLFPSSKASFFHTEVVFKLKAPKFAKFNTFSRSLKISSELIFPPVLSLFILLYYHDDIC